MPERPTGDDAFDQIVERLGMDLSFPDPEPAPPVDEPVDFDDLPDDAQDQFYRNVPPATEVLPRGRKAVAAWLAALGVPLGLAACTMLGVYLNRGVVLALCLVFVAAAVWLFSHLPERGPAHPDWPDDGAAL